MQRLLLSSSLQFSSVQLFSCVQLLATPWITARQASLSITNSWSSNSCPSSQWCHPAISSSVVPFPSCPQSLPASESFPTGQLFAWGGQSTGVSALTSLHPLSQYKARLLCMCVCVCVRDKAKLLCVCVYVSLVPLPTWAALCSNTVALD